MSFQLDPVQLAYCQGQWDPKKKRYTNSDSMDVIMCCVDSCKSYISDCFNSCHHTYGPKSSLANYKNHKKCHAQCSQLINNCESVCLSYPSKGIKELSACAETYNCGKFPLFDKDCLLRNKPEIIQCCNMDCGCIKECNQFWEHLAYGTDEPLAKIADKFNLNRADFNQGEKDNSYKSLFYFLVVILVLLGVYMLKN